MPIQIVSMFSEGTSPSPPARRIVIPVRNLAKSPQLGSSLRKSQQSSPLRSVENKLLCSSAPGTADFAGSTSKVKGGKAEANPPSTFSINMENIKNADISTIEKTANIRKEPFADHYAVESEIGRFVTIFLSFCLNLVFQFFKFYFKGVYCWS